MNCESSLLQAVAYDAPAAVLELKFHNGAIYRYFGVPVSTYDQFVRAESKGRYFNSDIRNRFTFVKLPLTATPQRNN
jgi:hypothetical protein